MKEEKTIKKRWVGLPPSFLSSIHFSAFFQTQGKYEKQNV